MSSSKAVAGRLNRRLQRKKDIRHNC